MPRPGGADRSDRPGYREDVSSHRRRSGSTLRPHFGPIAYRRNYLAAELDRCPSAPRSFPSGCCFSRMRISAPDADRISAGRSRAVPFVDRWSGTFPLISRVVSLAVGSRPRGRRRRGLCRLLKQYFVGPVTTVLQSAPLRTLTWPKPCRARLVIERQLTPRNRDRESSRTTLR